MSVSVSAVESSPVVRILTVEVDAERVRKAFNDAYRDLGRSVTVKGFRPGKAPRGVLESLYGASLREEIERTLVNQTFPEAIAQAGVAPIAEPEIETEPPAQDRAFKYTATIEVLPKIELPEWRGLPGTKPRVEVQDAEVEQELEALRNRRAPLADVDGPADTGHTLTLDYQGTIDGVAFEGGSAENSFIEIGSGGYIPGFEDQLKGARAGDARELRVTFPADYGAKELAGKSAVFAAQVKKVQKRETPALTDEFAKSLGDEGVTTVDALRARVRSDLETRKERSAKEELRRSVMEALVARASFDVPPGLVTRRVSQRLEMAYQQLGQFMPHEELHQRMDQWREEWRPEAEKEVRESLLLEAIADAEKIEIADAQLDERIAQMARDQGLAADRLRKQYDERDMLENLRGRLRIDAALDRVLSLATVA
ncbi:MAG: trigger factor [Deltaproteobacteria bacterium]|nr:trigger factor [Deltaproteobacteria bacterium]